MVTTPPLLNERYDPAAGGKWKDCAWASAMMLAYKKGKRDFPLGYGWQEREALERACSRPPETGANVGNIDEATQNRYGWKFDPITDLASTLRGPSNVGLLVGGNAHLYPDYQKRWDPHFCAQLVAAHFVYVQPMGDGVHVRLLDPEAVDGFTGDVIEASIIEVFNSGLPAGVRNVRIAKEPASPPPPPPSGVVLKYGGYEGYRGTWKVTANSSRTRTSPYIKSDNIIYPLLNAGALFTNAQTTDKGTYVNGSSRWLGSADGNTWIHVSLVSLVK